MIVAEITADGSFKRAAATITSSNWVEMKGARFGVIFVLKRGGAVFFLCESVAGSPENLHSVFLGGDGGAQVLIKLPALLVKIDNNETCVDMDATFDVDMAKLSKALRSTTTEPGETITSSLEDVLRANSPGARGLFDITDDDGGEGGGGGGDDDGAADNDDDIFAVFEDNDSCIDEDTDLDEVESDDDDPHADLDVEMSTVDDVVAVVSADGGDLVD